MTSGVAPVRGYRLGAAGPYSCRHRSLALVALGRQGITAVTARTSPHPNGRRTRPTPQPHGCHPALPRPHLHLAIVPFAHPRSRHPLTSPEKDECRSIGARQCDDSPLPLRRVPIPKAIQGCRREAVSRETARSPNRSKAPCATHRHRASQPSASTRGVSPSIRRQDEPWWAPGTTTAPTSIRTNTAAAAAEQPP